MAQPDCSAHSVTNLKASKVMIADVLRVCASSGAAPRLEELPPPQVRQCASAKGASLSEDASSSHLSLFTSRKNNQLQISPMHFVRPHGRRPVVGFVCRGTGVIKDRKTMTTGAA